MDKSANLATAIDELRKATNQTVAAAKALVALCKEDDNTQLVTDEPQPETQQKQSQPPTLEDVRTILADKSRNGHTEAIREIILQHGANKLTEVDPSHYASILAAAGELR